jgi:hypothetical protein
VKGGGRRVGGGGARREGERERHFYPSQIIRKENEVSQITDVVKKKDHEAELLQAKCKCLGLDNFSGQCMILLIFLSSG